MTYQPTKQTRQWAAIIGKQIEDSIKYYYGAGWYQFGELMRDDIIEGRIMTALIHVERFARGDMVAGEFEVRARLVREYVKSHINPTKE